MVAPVTQEGRRAYCAIGSYRVTEFVRVTELPILEAIIKYVKLSSVSEISILTCPYEIASGTGLLPSRRIEANISRRRM